MGFVANPLVAEIGLQYLVNGQKCANVFHVLKGSNINEADLNVISALFVDWWTDNLRTLFMSNVTLSSIIAKSMASQYAPAIEFSGTLPLSGNGDQGSPLPNNVTIAIKWSTGLRGRSYRGRTYHPALYENMVDANTMHSVSAAQIVAAYYALIGAVAAETFDLCVYSRFSGNVERTYGVPTVITNASMDPTVDSQRRRLPGRGE